MPLSFSSASEMIFRCANPKCDMVLVAKTYEAGSFDARCFSCHLTTTVSSHDGARYRAARSLHPLASPAQIIDLLYTLGGVTPCPRCGRMFELEGGCNHMQCPACRTGFNFKCGCYWVERAPWLLGGHSDPWAWNGCPHLKLPQAPTAWLSLHPSLWGRLVRIYAFFRVVSVLARIAIFLIAAACGGALVFYLAWWAGAALFSLYPITSPVLLRHPGGLDSELFARDWLPHLDVDWDRCPAVGDVCLATVAESLLLRLRSHPCTWAAWDRHLLYPGCKADGTVENDVARHAGRVRWASHFPIVTSGPILQICRRIKEN